MASRYCGHCKEWHEESDGYYFGPTYDCYVDTAPAEKALDLATRTDARLAKLENAIWAIQLHLGMEAGDD